MVVILMGVSGSGKTTLGLRLADDLGWAFIDADDFHSPEAVRRLAAGGPPSDADMKDWVAKLREQVTDVLARGRDAVVAYSALQSDARENLTVDSSSVRFVYLKGSASLVMQRLRNRSGHFLKANLVASQFATLEEPHDVVTVDIDERPGRIVKQIREALRI